MCVLSELLNVCRMVVGIQGLWNRIVTAASPWMTTAEASDGEPQSLQRSVFLDSLDSILRACGSEPASRRRERRDVTLVEADGPDKELLHHRPFLITS